MTDNIFDIKKALEGLLAYEMDIIDGGDKRSLLENRANQLGGSGYRIEEFRRFMEEDYLEWMHIVFHRNEYKLYVEENPKCFDEILSLVKDRDADYELKDLLNEITKIDGVAKVLAIGIMALIEPNRYGIINNGVLNQMKKLEMVSIEHVELSRCSDDELEMIERVLRHTGNEFNKLYPHHRWTPRMVDKALWGLEKKENGSK